MTVRVLAADNDATWIELLALDLRLEGFEVVDVVESAAAVLALLATRADDVDVLVTDHRMPPGATGLELLEQVRVEHPHIRAVLFTNYEMDTAARARIDAAGATYVAKPDLRALRVAVTAPSTSTSRSTTSKPPPPAAT